MDWLTFLAKLVEALAWPTVVVAFGVAARKHIPSALSRIKELSLPGGIKAEFSQTLDKVESEKEIVTSQSIITLEASIPKSTDMLELAEIHPEAAVIESYKNVESILIEIRSRLGIPAKSNLNSVINRMLQLKLIDISVSNMFRNFRYARNLASHAGANDRISPSAAIEFINQSRFLISILKEALSRINT